MFRLTSFGVIALVAFTAACSAAPKALPTAGGGAFATTASRSSAAPYLYIASKAPTNESKRNGMTSVFQVGQSTPLRIATDTVHPIGVAVDHDGNVYAVSQGNLYVYTPGLSQLVRTVPGIYSNTTRVSIVVDAQNDVYVIDQNGFLGEYSQGAAALLRELPVNAWAFAVDAASNVYVGSNNELQVYGPTGTTPIRTIQATNVDTIAIDSANHVYADVCPAGKGSIEVFSPTGTLIRSDPGCAHFLALDRNDYLHAGYQGANINLGGNLVIYKPYSFRPFKVIRHGIHRIRAMIVDPKGNIYVANGRGGTNVGDVAMYLAGNGVPSWTASGGARNGITYPDGLALWQP